MNIKYNLEELKDILWSFYTVSGIRFILFDADCNKIISYPETDCNFCTTMRKYAVTARKCAISDRKSLKACRESQGPILYKCHAGLVEAALALRQNDSIVGYLMFGQVTDNKNSEEVINALCKYCGDYGISSEEVKQSALEIRYTESSYILAAAKIMEACTSYIILKELITPHNSRILSDAKDYIEQNLDTYIDVSKLCFKLNISRTKLYEIFANEAGCGISEYIRKRRMHKAKKLLTDTAMPIWEIAHSVGFQDYTYFTRVFKKTYGKSPREFRKEK